MNNWQNRILKVDRTFPSEDYVENLPGVLIRVMEWNDRRRVIIELSDDTTSTDLRRAIPYALTWQKRVRKTTMPYSRRKQALLLEGFDNAQKTGMTYREIANGLNIQIANALKKSISNRYALISVYVDLRTVGFELDEIDNIVQDGQEQIKSGKEPFESEYPVDRERMIRVLRQWRKQTTGNSWLDMVKTSPV